MGDRGVENTRRKKLVLQWTSVNGWRPTVWRREEAAGIGKSRGEQEPLPPPTQNLEPSSDFGARHSCAMDAAACQDQPSALTVGFWWDRSSALVGIDRWFLLGSTVSCKVSSGNGNCTRRFGATERRTFSVFLIAI
jgi:hypothetical protein